MGWAVASIALIGTACGGGSGESAAGDDEGPTSFEDIEYESPIAEFLGQDLDFDNEESQAEYEAQARAVEQQVAACMAEEGFEYTPVDQSQFMSFETDQDIPYFSDEWVEKYGFGITTQRFSQSMLNDELVGYDDSMGAATEAEAIEDPNSAYVESLSPAEQEAYYAALYGDQPEFDENATEEEMNEAYEDFVPTGCQNTAWEEQNPSQTFYQEFSDDLEDMYERIEADPAVAKYRDEVTACVAEEGLVYTNQEDLYTRWEEDLASLDPFASGDPFEGTGLDPEEMSQEEMDEFFRTANKLDAEELAKLAEIQAEELELARVVIECGGGPLNEESILSEVRVALEQEFLDANADRLAEFENSAADS